MTFAAQDITVLKIMVITPLSIVTFDEQEDVCIYYKEDTEKNQTKS